MDNILVNLYSEFNLDFIKEIDGKIPTILNSILYFELYSQLNSEIWEELNIEINQMIDNG